MHMCSHTHTHSHLRMRRNQQSCNQKKFTKMNKSFSTASFNFLHFLSYTGGTRIFLQAACQSTTHFDLLHDHSLDLFHKCCTWKWQKHSKNLHPFKTNLVHKGSYSGSHFLRLGFLFIQLFPQSADLGLVLGLDHLKLVVQLADARINHRPRKCTYMYICVICTEEG